MSHIPHIPPRDADDVDSDANVGWPMVDTLYDYMTILSHTKTIAKLPKPLWGSRVGIVGGGVAGIVAAYELFRAGFNPVLFEATSRIGGRNYSRPFAGVSGAFAELGAMRVPPSCKAFFHYADLLNFQYTEFPDPGKVPTTLFYNDQIYHWKPPKKKGDKPNPPPGIFADIQTQFSGFIESILEPVFVPWRKGDLDGVRKEWQKVISRYANVSFIHAITEGIPEWGPSQRKAFGALGMGSGGFGPMYPVGFLEMLRVLANKWETNQQLMRDGISELPDGLYKLEVTRPDGKKASLKSAGVIRASTPVTRITRNGSDIEIHFRDSQGNHVESFPAAIVATTSHAAEYLGLTVPAEPKGKPLLDAATNSAIRNLPMVNSSKLFIRTKSKFWANDPEMPQNIQTDEMPRGIYCLDYPQTNNGVVLVSYTWRDDSTRLTGCPPAKRLETFKYIIERICPKFAENLVPEDDEIVVIDWQSEDYYFGAFKLDQPGQETFVQNAYYQFLDVLNPQSDPGIYLAGDSVSFAGGWTEGAIETGLNAASAAAKRIGAKLPDNSPLTQNKNLYDYTGS
jgi:tryptophan 2-monooxygenase